MIRSYVKNVSSRNRKVYHSIRGYDKTFLWKTQENLHIDLVHFPSLLKLQKRMEDKEVRSTSYSLDTQGILHSCKRS